MIGKLIKLDDYIGEIQQEFTANTSSNDNNYVTIALPNGKKYVDSVKIKVNVQQQQPVVGHANITKNGQYLPNEFNSTTGNLLPSGTTSNNQYLEQINVDTTKILKITNGLSFRSYNGNTYGLYSFTRVYSSTTINLSVCDECVYCIYNKNDKTLTVYCCINAASSGSFTLSPTSNQVIYYWKNNYVPHANTYNVAVLYESSGNVLMEIRDLGAGDGESSIQWSYCMLGPEIAKVPY